MSIFRISIGSDHAGVAYKQAIINHLKDLGHVVQDCGPSTDQSVDYPDYIHPTVSIVENNQADFGIILCGSGQGAAITANKHQGIRAALVWNSEIAELARLHNNANVIAIPARFITLEQAIEFIQIFLSTPFEGGRHQLRVNKIPCN